MKKIAFVVQRYGKEVNGGAETHCMQIAERLAKLGNTVEVLTTCAVDYYSWKNEYKKGETRLDDVTIRRFKVDKKRNMSEFNGLSERAFSERENTSLGKEWMKSQGPYSSELFDHIEQHQDDYDVFIFFTYLYATTYFGTARIRDKKKIVLIPTAHDEPPIYLNIFDDMFARAGCFIFNTDEEKAFLYKRFGRKIQSAPSIIAGVGVELPKDFHFSFEHFKKRNHLTDYVIYVGRIDEPKGCNYMFRMWEQYKKIYPSDLKLVLMGKEEIMVPKREDILSLGFVNESDKYNGMAGAKCMLIPSVFESLSMVLLESFLCKVPVLVNEKSEVLKGHCLRSNGGIWYGADEEFVEGLQFLLTHETMRKKLGSNGHTYVKEHYSWPKVLEKISSFLTRVC